MNYNVQCEMVKKKRENNNKKNNNILRINNTLV